MGAANSYVNDVLARIDDFVGPGAQWQRTLWQVGLPFALRELKEVSDGVQSGALSPALLKRFSQAVASLAASDHAAGEPAPRQRLKTLLTQDLSAGGTNYHELCAWIDDVETHGLTRWQAAVASSDKPGREHLARALANEFLRQELSTTRIRTWVKELRSSPDSIDEDLLMDKARTLAGTPATVHRTMLLFDRPPSQQLAPPIGWTNATRTRGWLHDHGFQPIRQHGGVKLAITARDPHTAAQIAADAADRLRARSAVGSRTNLEILSEIFVAGHPEPIAAERSRRAEVRALEREGRLLDVGAFDAVDQALELLSHLNTAPAPVAAAAGWAAVESLLSGPGDQDKVITADRLANLVACSWPRAELTTIAWARVHQMSDTSDAIADELRAYATNRERADRILRAIQVQEDLQLTRPAERMAIQRMERLIRDPRGELIAVRERAGEALRRLYRQRNLVVHGGQTAGFGLAAALRTAAPLVGAGIDRLTHAALVSGTQPLALAARAQMEIERAGTRNAPALTSMLE